MIFIFEQFLTVAIALDLTLGEVMLLPMAGINSYKRETLKDEYAPFLAKQISRTDKREEAQKWIRMLPPETLEKLLSCLLKRQSERSDNEQQVRAILNIMQWIQPISSDDPEAKCRQFEETLFQMNTNIKTKQSALAQWNNFGQNWLKIARFIKDYGSIEQSGKFNRINNILCKNMELQKYSNHILGINKISYICYQINSNIDSINEVKKSLSSMDYKKMNWDIYEL
ncbi:hypothetical protein C0W35_20930 [Photobacterium kishitanii]|uniref:hypothetical protein n=1 Tax=Photobacterium kishitanii TaxID=318456 RepID=UPI000D179CCD|nr:hypothetical protein [Photobacterium kishitanii]PSU88010.1 hypothetical protein C0W35_20930 [Photobacterium kishitanii]